MDDIEKNSIRDWIWWSLDQPHRKHNLFPFDESTRWVRFYLASIRKIHER